MHRDIDAPAELLWALLVEIHRWPQWGPSVRAVELDSPRLHLGSAGSVRTVGGLTLPFEITDLVEGRCWAWRVGGITATDHRVESRAIGCRVSFGVPWWATPYLGVCAVALRRLERLATEERVPA